MEFGVVIFKRIIALVTSEIKFRLTTVDNVVVLQLYENCRACCVLGWVEGNASVSVSRLLFGRKLDSGSESRFNGTSQQSRGVKWQWGQWSINGLVVDDTIFGTTLKWIRISTWNMFHGAALRVSIVVTKWPARPGPQMQWTQTQSFFLTVIKISHQLENWIYSCQNWTINSRGWDACSMFLHPTYSYM